MNEIATVPDDAADFMVIAQRPDQMRAAQEKTIVWVKARIDEATLDLNSAEVALAAARNNAWRLTGFQRHVGEAKKRIEFYEKMLAALEAGYVIVPNFPIDIFAIRTKREAPRGEEKNWVGANHDQKSERPALGEGEYFDSKPSVTHEEYTVTKDGKEIAKHRYYPEAFLPVDFPVKLVHPQILDAAGRAMALKTFDELGILPSRRAKGDPMIIAQIVHKAGTRETRVSFLVAWWLTENDLRV